MVTQAVKKCGLCQREFPVSAVYCPYDGNSLAEAFHSAAEPVSPAPEPEADAADPLVGRTIERRYRIVEAIGHGGMGTVYRAVHTDLNRPFAVKVIRRELVSDSVATRRFRREARALGAISHPNAVTVTDFGMTEDGLAYLVMEHLDGVTLRFVVSNESPLGLVRASTILSQVCGAVDAAHRQGIVHRDLKPENVMLVETETGETAKVLDFGTAMLKSREAMTGKLTANNIVVGTPRYMSPEGCEGFEQTALSDVYSLGVVLFEMITGRVPFEAPPGESEFAIAKAHISEPPPVPSELNPSLTPAIDAVVLRALAKKPEDRFESATDLAAAFELAVSAIHDNAPPTSALRSVSAYLNAETTLGDTEPGDTAPAAPPRRRTTLFVVLATLAAFLLVVGLAGAAVLFAWRMGWLGAP
jgi:serine/threonine-protein kinase